MKNILVTGGAGFIGSNFIPYFLNKHNCYNIINLDKLSYAGKLRNLLDVSDNLHYKFIKADICNREFVEYIFDEYSIDAVIHFAAESHVDNSIKDPEIFIRTNVQGTYNLIDIARKKWDGMPNRFHHISTDEVYGSLGEKGLFNEATPYAPNSPYSASKAASDMVIRAYNKTYGMNTVITNSSNNYGPKQHREKLIPTIIRNALNGTPIPIYGDGKNIRDWVYVLDHCKAIDMVFHHGACGESYNIGGNSERDNISVATEICSILDKMYPRLDNKSYSEQITYVADRKGHDKRYAIDTTKIELELGWNAEESFESGLLKTVKWYLDNIYILE